MADIQITCITRAGGTGHEHITQVGTPGGTRWTVAQVVQSLNAKTNTFFVHDSRSARRADVGVVAANPPYIRTYADGIWTDNLLSLPACA